MFVRLIILLSKRVVTGLNLFILLIQHAHILLIGLYPQLEVITALLPSYSLLNFQPQSIIQPLYLRDILNLFLLQHLYLMRMLFQNIVQSFNLLTQDHNLILILQQLFTLKAQVLRRPLSVCLNFIINIWYLQFSLSLIVTKHKLTWRQLLWLSL